MYEDKIEDKQASEDMDRMSVVLLSYLIWEIQPPEVRMRCERNTREKHCYSGLRTYNVYLIHDVSEIVIR